MEKMFRLMRGCKKNAHLRKIWMTMKLTIFLFFLAISQMMAVETYSQSTLLSLNLNSVAVKDVLDEIEGKSEFVFLYNSKLVDADRTVSMEFKDQKISYILDKIFQNTDVVYTVVDRQIVLTNKADQAGFLELNAVQQQKSVSGKVTDSTGAGLPGVSIVVKGTTTGVITDSDGKFNITKVPENATLQFSFVGMKSQEIVVGGKTSINVSLVEDAIGIEEVVAIGYGTKTKGALTGSVATASGEKLESRPVTNTMNAIQGIIPGVTVTRSSGRPGQEDYQFQIRGFSSMNGNKPLVLIDGIAGDMGTLNPNDIENISVLKDASAAIYGARSADGVILITTKSGVKGKTQITYSGNMAVKTPSYTKNMASPYHMAQMFDEGRVNDGDAPKYTPDDFTKMLNNDPGVGPGRMLYLEDYPNFYRHTDWADVIFKNSILQSHNVAINGGNDQVKFMVSGGYLANNGVFAFGENNSKRYNFRTNLTVKLRENITLDTRVAYEHEDYIEPAETEVALGAVCQSWTYLPVYNPKGSFYEYQGYANPAQWLAESGTNQTANRKFRANTKLDWVLVEGLTLTTQAGLNVGNKDSEGFWRTFQTYNWDNNINTIRRSPNMASYVDDRDWYKNLTAYLNYAKIIGGHSFGAMAGSSHEEYDFKRKVMEGQGFANNEIYPLSLANPTMLYASSRGYNWRIEDWSLSSYFGRLSYSFNGKYYADATIRLDGSSKFSPENRWSKAYPGISLAWKISEESFMKAQNVLDMLKIRGSWGQTGNQDIGALGMYDYIQLINIGGKYPMGTSNSPVAGASMKGMASPNRTWETITNMNVGIDFGLFRSRLNGSFDVYQKKNTNMLVDVVYPSTLGATAPSTNSGELTTKGWDLNVNWGEKLGDFSYKLGFVVSYNDNKLTDLKGQDNFSLGLNTFREGYPINSYFGFQSVGIIKTQQDLDNYSKYAGKGIVPTTAPNGQKGLGIGDIMYKDVDGDGAITTYGDPTKGFNGDAVYLGSANPKYNYGITAEAKFKNFDFSMLWQGTGKKMVIRTGDFATPFYWPWFQPFDYFYEKTWSKDRPEAQYPRISHSDNVKRYNYRESSTMIENTAYLRLKNLQVGYTIPKSLAQKVSVDNVRVYFSGQDLFEFTNGDWDGNYDPEEGQSFNTYPFFRAYSFGIDVKF
jgi:TonB-linked SusC/RagA family outer membrane protein